MPRITKRVSRGLVGVVTGIALVSLGLVLVSRAVPFPERLQTVGSTVIYFHDATAAHVFLSPDEKWRIRVPLAEVDPKYVDALIRIEDKRFWYHLGVDPLAVGRAMLQNIKHGRVVAGGSTITMQLVRMLEPRPRTIRSKLIEAFRAIQLELRLSKVEILEAYLQLVPYGKNIEGIEAAALSYFGHRARSLSLAEIATLLVVPQNPNRRFPSTHNKQRLHEARDRMIDRLLATGVLVDQDETGSLTPVDLIKSAKLSKLPTRLRAFPRHAPHAARWLKVQRPSEEHIHTTLDRGMQILVERVMTSARQRARRNGIFNGSVVLADHREAKILALLGNIDFWDAEHSGQIVGFDVPRSPGSLLKPFIYALAIDRGLVLPDYLVPDIPVEYAGYAPQNYDGNFRGVVRLEDALSWSLNLPFVNLLRRVKVHNFLGALKTMDVQSLSPEPGYYGLSAAIGGIELTPLEVASLYATLASNGLHRPLALVAQPQRASESNSFIDVFSPGSAYLTKQALSLRDRPDFPSRRDVSRMPPNIHWKTGTSVGHRDAWAAGSGPRYTAVVWLGNFDNAPSAELIGAEAAGPALFDILEGVTNRRRPEYAALPTSDLKRIEICAVSGRLPTPACPRTKSVLALRRNVPITLCPIHKTFHIDSETGLALLPNCRATRKYATETFTVWPASVRRWLKDRDGRVPQPPSFAPGCRGPMRASPPRILSPPTSSDVFLVAGMPADKQEIPLEAESSQSNGYLSWFVDGRFLRTIDPDGRIWWTPTPGRHEIMVIDDAGRSDRRILFVRANH